MTTYEVTGFTNEQIGRLMSEVGCADRIERIKRLMWEAQEAMRRAIAATTTEEKETADEVSR